MLEPRIVEKPALNVVGMEAVFIHSLSPDATNFKVIGPLWDAFVLQAPLIAERSDQAMFGIIYALPPEERMHPDERQYIAGVAVSGAAAIPSGMVARTIPAGTFAVFTHRGPINTIATTIFEIYRVWLPQSGYKHAQIADVEVYDHRFCPENGGDPEMDYWISVTPHAAPA